MYAISTYYGMATVAMAYVYVWRMTVTWQPISMVTAVFVMTPNKQYSDIYQEGDYQ